MKEITYRIDPRVLALFPGFLRGVLLCLNVQNASISPPELTSLLRHEQENLLAAYAAEQLAGHPGIVAWREAYRLAGIKPSEFRPSMEAMARRVLSGHWLPSISPLVDIGNIISLRYLIPIGAHALTHLRGDISLRPASGHERFTAFGTEQEEQPATGEIILSEADDVMTRRWTWRQSNHSMIWPETQALFYNIDCLPPCNAQAAARAAADLQQLVTTWCGGTCQYQVLSKDRPSIKLAFG